MLAPRLYSSNCTVQATLRTLFSSRNTWQKQVTSSLTKLELQAGPGKVLYVITQREKNMFWERVDYTK